jgi:hypothetical protein
MPAVRFYLGALDPEDCASSKSEHAVEAISDWSLDRKLWMR